MDEQAARAQEQGGQQGGQDGGQDGEQVAGRTGATRLGPRRSRGHRVAWAGALTVVVALGGGSAAYAASQQSAGSVPPARAVMGTGTGVAEGSTAVVPGQRRYRSLPGYGGGYGGSTGDGTGSTTSSGTAATAAQEAGVVTVLSVLGEEGAEAAGTGIVLTADGDVLTNNHVVQGATSTQVTVPATGRTYTATVVGTDAADDVAVLHLTGASGLTTAAIDGDGAALGEAVTAVGNAGGTGALVAAIGTITGLDASVTTQPELGSDGESLTGMLQTSADVVSGDSGGPLLDADGEVVGIDTAASSGTADVTGWAIPVARALAVASQIEAGEASSTITIGTPGLLGVELAGTSSDGTSSATGDGGAVVGAVVSGSPAAQAGLAAGDTVTALGGTSVADAQALVTAVAGHRSGDAVSVSWTDAAGASHTAQVVLASGPAA